MLFGGPAAHVSADFGDQLQRTIGANAVELAEVCAAGNAMQRRAQPYPRFVFAGLAAGARRRKLGWGWRAGVRQTGELGLDGLVTVGDLLLVELERRKVLTQHEQVFGAVVAGQRRGNLWFTGLATAVAMGRQ